MFAVSYKLRSNLFIHYRNFGVKMPKPLKKFFDRESGAGARARRFGRRIADRFRGGVSRLQAARDARRARRG